MAVQVRVTDTVQPATLSAPSVNIGIRPVVQLSETDAEPNAALTSAVVGLHPNDDVEVRMITGASVSRVKVMV